MMDSLFFLGEFQHVRCLFFYFSQDFITLKCVTLLLLLLYERGRYAVVGHKMLSINENPLSTQRATMHDYYSKDWNFVDEFFNQFESLKAV